MLWFVFLFAGYNLRHTHLWILWPKPLRYVISSPALHQIHHSTAEKHFDKNFARTFIFWDWLFGTLYLPTEREEITYGLGEEENRKYRSLKQIYLEPFKGATALYLKKDRPPLAEQ